MLTDIFVLSALWVLVQPNREVYKYKLATHNQTALISRKAKRFATYSNYNNLRLNDCGNARKAARQLSLMRLS